MQKINYLPFEDYSNKIEKSYSKMLKNNILEYRECSNNNLIVEGTFNRLVAQMKDKDFAILSAYRNNFTKEENILRNRNLRGILNMKRMGVHQLVGHWLENPDGGDYKSADPSKLKDCIERSYFIAKPNDMEYKEFRAIILKCMTIDGETQDAAIIHIHRGGYYCLYSNGGVEKIGENISFNKVAQAYSQYVKRLDIPFVFEGVESPSSNSGKMMFEMNNIKYIVSDKVIDKNTLKDIVSESIKKILSETTRRQKAIQAIKGESKNIKTCAILTAANPLTQGLPKKFNDRLNEKLKAYLKVGNFVWFPVKGQYGSPEDSFIIYNISLEDALHIGEKYEQESIIWVDNRGEGIVYQYWEQNGNGLFKKTHEKSYINDMADADDMFTQIGRNFKFQISFFEGGDIEETILKKHNDILGEAIKKNIEKNGYNVEWVNERINHLTDNTLSGRGLYESRGKIYGGYRSIRI